MGMYVCEEHDDCKVVYDSKDCPICELSKRVDDLEEENDLQDKEIQDLKVQEE